MVLNLKHLSSALIRKQALGVLNKTIHRKGEIILILFSTDTVSKSKLNKQSLPRRTKIFEARANGNQLSTDSYQAWDYRSTSVWEKKCSTYINILDKLRVFHYASICGFFFCLYYMF